MDCYFLVRDPGAVAAMTPLVMAAPPDVRSVWIPGPWVQEHGRLTCAPRMLPSEFGDVKPVATDTVVLGASMDFTLTQATIAHLTTMGWRTFFLLDHWCHYTKHFESSKGLSLPTGILVMDELAKRCMVERGIPIELVHVVGHPGIERQLAQLSHVNVGDVRQKLDARDTKRLILLALEPIRDDFADNSRGYDEFSVFALVRDAIAKLPGCELVVRLHPRQDLEHFRSVAGDAIRLCPNDVSVAESIAASDVVVGVTSAFLISSIFSGKPTLSLQPDRTEYAQTLSCDYLESCVVTRADDVLPALTIALGRTADSSGNRAYDFPMDSANRFWRVIHNATG